MGYTGIQVLNINGSEILTVIGIVVSAVRIFDLQRYCSLSRGVCFPAF